MDPAHEKYDPALLGILQNEGQIAKFLDVIYGFLFRRTDFYLTMKTQDAKMGFPPGVAMKLTVGAFKKYADKMEHMQKKQEQLEAKQRAKAQNISDTRPPPAVRTEEVVAMETESSSTPSTTDSVQSELRSAATTDKTSSHNATPADTSTPSPSSKSDHADTSPRAALPQPAADSSDTNTQNTEKQQQDKKTDEDDGGGPGNYQADPECYNGAVRDNYTWSQTISDLDIRIEVPKHIKKGADVKLDMERKHLRARVRGLDRTWETVLDGALTWDINKEESMWTLVPGEHIHVNFEKVQERWWEGVLTNEPKINVRKIDASRPITDLDDEAQAKIQEMMFNEQQKRLGKPQSHEMKVHDMLKKAWDAEGSPFKGQEFDPSKFNVSPNNQF